MNLYLKAVIAALIPVLTSVLLWISTGTLDAEELAVAFTGLVTALIVYLVPNSRQVESHDPNRRGE